MGTIGQLDTRHFSELVRRYGEVPLRYFRRIGPCPNTHMSAISGFDVDPDCAICGGVGEVFKELEIPGIVAASKSDGKVVLTGGSQNRRRDVPMDTAEMQCSYLPDDYPMAPGDRIVMGSRLAFHEETQTRDMRDSGATTENLRYWPVIQIDHVYGQSGEVDASEYVVSTDGLGITFSGATLSAGDTYTVAYRYRPQYVVGATRTSRIHASNGDRFPERCSLREWQGMATDVREDDL